MPLLETFGNATARGWRSSSATGVDFQLIATQVVSGSPVAAVTFSSIPQTYRHLQLRVVARNTVINSSYLLQYNSVMSGYYYNWLDASGSAVSAGAQATTVGGITVQNALAATNGDANLFGLSTIDITDYSQTNNAKVIRARATWPSSTGGKGVTITSGNLPATTAITSLALTANGSSATFAVGSRFSLYGWN